jgi:hypothetical protein
MLDDGDERRMARQGQQSHHSESPLQKIFETTHCGLGFLKLSG